MNVQAVSEQDLPDLLPLMRAYCDFYDVAPSDEALLTMARALIADPDRQGVQFIARDDDGTAIGFATVFWTWATTVASRVGVMNDLFVDQRVRGRRVGEALIAACLARTRERGFARLEWQTALDNHSGQALYDRVGGVRSQWLDYHLDG
jgi:GNAT superfamily N-acetyltransferase